MILTARVAELTDDGLLRKNVLLNLASWILPAGAAIASLPILAAGLGAARFGMVALAWSAVALFTFFDFGLGRALTRMIAERSARGHTADVPDLVWTSAWIILGASAVLSIIGLVAAPLIATRVLHVPAALHGEATAVVRWLAIGLPFMAHGVVLRGVLEAEQRFGLANRLRVPLGLATYAGPLLAIPLHGGASMAVGIVVAARALYWVLHFPLLERVLPGLSRPRGYSRSAARELARVGGWITVSNVVSPLLVQADRIAVAVALPIAASGWYGTAAEVATKQWLFTAALQPVLFAALATTIAHDPERAGTLMSRATRVTMMVLFPAALVLVAFAEPLLRLWMRAAYAPPAVDVLRWLAIAVFVNASAQVPYAALQGGADARAPALVHLVELPAYATLLWLLVRNYGVSGAAMACCARMTLDGVAMWGMGAHRIPQIRRVAIKAMWMTAGSLVLLGLAWAWAARHA